jgi:hypothetical protein
MVRLRENINPEEDHGIALGPTKYITASNRYGLHCVDCGELYYVDEAIMQRVKLAHEADPTEIPFRCSDCEEGYADEESSR